MQSLASNSIETSSLPSTLEIAIDCIDFANAKARQQPPAKLAAWTRGQI